MTAPAEAPPHGGPGGAAPWLTVVGCLPSGALAPGAPPQVLEAEAVFGPARLLDAAGVAPERRRPWPRPFAAGIAALLTHRGRTTTVLASGDPLHHGVAATLLRDLTPEEMTVHPAPSAFSLAAAALRWPLEDVAQISLHTAPPEDILRTASPGRRILALTRDGDAPRMIAAALTAAGYGASAFAVLEALGGPDAAIHRTTAAALTEPAHALNVVAVECRGGASAVQVDNLAHDGCVTRDEVRLLTLAALRLPPGVTGHLWDVGAGSGAVGIDWCRTGGTATLFERHEGRLAAIRANLAATGTARAHVAPGDAHAALAGAARPSHVFMGGGLADDALFAALWAALPPGGVFVSNAVTLAGEAATLLRQAAHGGALTRIALSFSAPIGGLMALKPAMPVLQWRAVKR
ncbi:precorrin-6y C5,15-methyltransferase (decarboxylating) subunit CbiE [Acuticoccus sp. I52.16.1]|uniref:precorrin-6y C5,15-methyltransferase (decarboxylating) subunit CbiE n=1 Tax=Acuticoccus sp. I52.16.1 TaxID=2928472 RepID=UPI001FD62C01|nr:precorrin-6y C5,15-methyltransferase (decarboxylating) subunit CbiE [Acuticoccus sp. I52.16.1]UOM35885.1 precorrin-6y C5,15-methyltransferase (decarboxylating) subunit CbiE [Acuticoccus sp. I52.16.1]